MQLTPPNPSLLLWPCLLQSPHRMSFPSWSWLAPQIPPVLKLKERKDFMLEVLFYFVLLLQKWGLNPGPHGCQASI